LHGDLSKNEKERFLLKLDSSDKLREEFDFFQRVNDSAADLDHIKLFDEEVEWNAIESKLEDKQSSNSKSRYLRIFSIAASILVLGFLLNYFFTEKPLYQEVATGDNLDTIRLVDGSVVYLGKNSQLKYFVRQDEKTNRRYVELIGDATFDIAHDKDLPFVLKTQDAGIDVLGTIFKVERVSTGIGFENIRGLINLFEWENASNSLILKEGEKAIFTPDGIRRVLPKPVKVDLSGGYYKVEKIIDLLFEKYETRFSTAPYADVRMEDEVFIDIDQPLESILSQLDTTADIKYRKTCKNCYEISVLRSK